VQVGILSDEGHLCGSVRDISVSGAHIEHTGRLPAEGEQLQLGFAFYAHALPVPMQARVVRHTGEGGFAVEFEEVDFRTQVLLRSLLPNVANEAGEAVDVSKAGRVEMELTPVLRSACLKAAERRGQPIEAWILAALEAAALEDGD
jgi:hypothetical protein